MPESRAIRRLRADYRPEVVRVLLVGESAPAGGTHYYLANSILFSAVRQAFTLVYGARTPLGEEFLGLARDAGVWLVDLAAEPVNHMAPTDRRRLVKAGARRVTRQIRETSPQFVVAIKATIAGAVAECVERSGSTAELVALPFPAMQGRWRFVEGLATVIRRARRSAAAAVPKRPVGTTDA